METEAFDIFQEPEGFYQAEKQPTYVSHHMLDGRELSLRLIGHSPLWGHLLWNAGRTLATYLEENASSLIKDKNILELGAGAGLPSLVCASQGAKSVVITDYPDADLIENLQHNITKNNDILPHPRNVHAEGYLWGTPIEPLIAHLPAAERTAGFDLLILGDLLFNHSEHSKLLFTIQKTLKRTPEAQALVFFTPYRPWLLEKDLAFFDLARDADMLVEKVLEKVMDSVMFEQDPGDEKLRRTVFGYSVRWPL